MPLAKVKCVIGTRRVEIAQAGGSFVDLFYKKPSTFLLDYESALMKREWISCDDMSWLTQILMEQLVK